MEWIKKVNSLMLKELRIKLKAKAEPLVRYTLDGKAYVGRIQLLKTGEDGIVSFDVDLKGFERINNGFKACSIGGTEQIEHIHKKMEPVSESEAAAIKIYLGLNEADICYTSWYSEYKKGRAAAISNIQIGLVSKISFDAPAYPDWFERKQLEEDLAVSKILLSKSLKVLDRVELGASISSSEIEELRNNILKII